MIMIDITRIQGNQTTRDGMNEDWVFTLDKEVLYTLPAHFTVQETFMIRDVLERIVNIAVTEMKEQEQQLCLVKMDHIIKQGNTQLASLKAENERLATVLEQHIINDEVV